LDQDRLKITTMAPPSGHHAPGPTRREAQNTKETRTALRSHPTPRQPHTAPGLLEACALVTAGQEFTATKGAPPKNEAPPPPRTPPPPPRSQPPRKKQPTTPTPHPPKTPPQNTYPDQEPPPPPAGTGPPAAPTGTNLPPHHPLPNPHLARDPTPHRSHPTATPTDPQSSKDRGMK